MAIIDGQQRRHLDETGFLTVERATHGGEIAWVRSIVEGLFERRAGIERGDYLDLVGDDLQPGEARLPQILMPVNYAPELAGCRLRADAEEMARCILGQEIRYEGEHVIAKPPGGPATHLHQDEAFWSGGVDYTSISIWFPLQDVTAENGCICYVPGSHRLGVLPHHSIDDDVSTNGLEIDGAGSFAPVAVPLGVGGATIHHCRTIHGALSNVSRTVRYAYIFGFGLEAVRAAEPRNYYWLSQKKSLREERARKEGFELTKMRPEF